MQFMSPLIDESSSLYFTVSFAKYTTRATCRVEMKVENGSILLGSKVNKCLRKMQMVS